MSRHTLGIATGHLVLGWDPPLQTFFLQVHDRATEGPRIWLGCTFAEIPTIEALFDHARPHLCGTVWNDAAYDLRQRLLDEQRRDVA